MFEIERIVRTALEEDIGLGDVTTEVERHRETSVRNEDTRPDERATQLTPRFGRVKKKKLKIVISVCGL